MRSERGYFKDEVRGWIFYKMGDTLTYAVGNNPDQEKTDEKEKSRNKAGE